MGNTSSLGVGGSALSRFETSVEAGNGISIKSVAKSTATSIVSEAGEVIYVELDLAHNDKRREGATSLPPRKSGVRFALRPLSENKARIEGGSCDPGYASLVGSG